VGILKEPDPSATCGASAQVSGDAWLGRLGQQLVEVRVVHGLPSGPDSDNDTIADVCDNCVYTPNKDQKDYDNDGIGNACDPHDGYTLLDDRAAALAECLRGPCSKFDVSTSGDLKIDFGLMDTVLGDLVDSTNPDGEPDISGLIDDLVTLADGKITDAVVVDFLAAGADVGIDTAELVATKLGFIE